jgi:hypothetical protein
LFQEETVMPVHRFIGYFFALAACSTLAFASFGPDAAVPQDTLAADASPYALPPPDSLSAPYSLGHRHRAGHLHLQIAQAQ